MKRGYTKIFDNQINYVKTDWELLSKERNLETISDESAKNISVLHFEKMATTIAFEWTKRENFATNLIPSTISTHWPSSDVRSDISVYAAKCDPPTWKEVQKYIYTYNIPDVQYQDPYYSESSHVTGNVEIGNSTLKISSKLSVHAPEFRSTFNNTLDNIRSYSPRMYNNVLTENKTLQVANICVHKEQLCIVTPVKLPPTYKEIIAHYDGYIKNQSKLKNQKIEVHLPLRPQKATEFSDESLTISRCSFNNSIPIPKIIKLNVDLTNTEKNQESEEHTCNELDYGNKQESGNVSKRAILHSDFLNQLRYFDPSVNNLCQITGVTVNNSSINLSVENLQNAKIIVENQFLTTLIMELHLLTRDDFKPNPRVDPIRAIFYNLVNDVPNRCKTQNTIGVLLVSESPFIDVFTLDGTEVNSIVYADSEISLINKFVEFVHTCDPDIFAGYEIEMLSWGYLIERGLALGINLQSLLSRIPYVKTAREQNDRNGCINLPGRIVLDVWRLMKHEITAQSYTLENIVYHVLHKRLPLYSFKDLSFWWEHAGAIHRCNTLKYYLLRVKAVGMMLGQLDLINRTCELARLFGIQFYEVLSRGSQFRVESMMLRVAKPLNYIAVSPTVEQRSKMRAPEFLPLILEPESKYYSDPVIVLDFQSLYPSIIIAYNYCFSTCIGRVNHLGKDIPFEFGATQLRIPRVLVKKLLFKNKINFSPCGVAFVKPEVCKGILPRMLEEILNTRLLIKMSMKANLENKVLQRVLHSRQLGLKLIANVTYGYTAANFSGRMPCVEVADSVVSKGRETLQRAIDMVDKTKEWGAKVIYGDTDSLFVLVSGKSKADAFKIGEKIAASVTKDNPSPVKLKLEKVYHPCILQTKKRYVGNMFESPDQEVPVFDAKGIETVRRDGCPAASKVSYSYKENRHTYVNLQMLEKSLKLLFENVDVSSVRKYVVKQFNKIILGKVSIQDLTFAKEYRGASGYRPGACVPALELAK